MLIEAYVYTGDTLTVNLHFDQEDVGTLTLKPKEFARLATGLGLHLDCPNSEENGDYWRSSREKNDD